MKISLFEFQEQYVNELLMNLRTAQAAKAPLAISLVAPTGSGKTAMLAGVIERALLGSSDETGQVSAGEPNSIFLWLSDMPDLNKQSMNKLLNFTEIRRQQFCLIDEKFDEKELEPGRIYFLNTQKLSVSALLTRSGDKRQYTIWETLRNTIQKFPNTFTLIIDEAHRGMTKEVEDRKPIVQRFLFKNDFLPVIPTVIGLSATPERFENLLNNKRSCLRISVEASKVRESGLIKQNLIIASHTGNIPSDMTIVEAAAEKWKGIETQWNDYSISAGIPKIHPALVIQVADKGADSNFATKTNLGQLIESIERGIGRKIKQGEIAHCFDSQTQIQAVGLGIPYIEPSKVQESVEIKFILFKMALTTGWDCPRAEVMMSFREANDSTYITQLVGRMVRAPLARKIEGSEILNETFLYLPKYNTNELLQIAKHLAEDKEVVPTINVKLASDFIETSIPSNLGEVRIKLMKLPSYSTSTGRLIPSVRRLAKFATHLVVDEIDVNASNDVREKISKFMQMRFLKLQRDDLAFRSSLMNFENVKVDSISIDQVSRKITNLDAVSHKISRKNIDDLFRKAKLAIGDDYATSFARLIHSEDKPSFGKYASYLFLHSRAPDIMEEINEFSAALIDSLHQKYAGAIGSLSREKVRQYSKFRTHNKGTKESEMQIPLTDVRFPVSKSSKEYLNHLYRDKSGRFKTSLNSWEEASILREIPNAVAWIRNLDRKDWSLGYEYQTISGYQVAYPDFVVVRRDGTGHLIVDILEPHDTNLADAPEKAKGLANYADKHGSQFGRIELQRLESNNKLNCLDFTQEKVRRDALSMDLTKSALENLFKKHGKLIPLTMNKNL